jgi:pterin-4a-carbinolamine dehydratase
MAGLPWFRMYARIIDDDKLRLLAFEDRWHFVALLALKCDGLLDEPESDIRARRIAVKLGVQVRELDEIGRRLGDVGLVDHALSPVAWDELQFKSDKSAERVKSYRERKKKQAPSGVKRYGNVTVTAQDTDTDTDTDEDFSASKDWLGGADDPFGGDA